MEFGADSAIDYIGYGSTIVHPHEIYVLKALYLGARHAICNRLVFHLHRVIQPWDGLECFAHGERIHHRAQADELDDRIALCFILELADLSGI